MNANELAPAGHVGGLGHHEASEPEQAEHGEDDTERGVVAAHQAALGKATSSSAEGAEAAGCATSEQVRVPMELKMDEDVQSLSQTLTGLQILMSWLIVELIDGGSLDQERVATDIAAIEQAMVLRGVPPATVSVLSKLLKDLDRHAGIEDPNASFRSRLLGPERA